MPSPLAPTRTVRSTRIRLVAVLAILLAAFAGTVARGAAQEVADLQVNSSRYIVIDAETGEVYAQRDADEQVAIGSLTKIFTVIEAMDIAPLDTVITTTEDDLRDPANNSIMGFAAGEELTLEELLYGLMLPSGNDAAHAVARSLGYQEGDTSAEQSTDRFMGWINQRVRDMGLVDTNLITPDGWGVPGHYTTAHDLAAFTRYAMQHPFFRTLISSAEYTTAAGNEIYNNNRLLGLYPDLVGGKTGYDWDAGWCLVEVAERDDMQMISVTLDGVHENMDWYDDNEVLLDYGFAQRSATRESSTPWDGRVASFADPDVAMLDRSAVTSAAIGGDVSALTYDGGAGAVETATDPQDPAAGQTTGQTDTVAPDTTTVAAAVDDAPIDDSAVLDTPQAATTAASSSTSALTRVAQVALILGIIGLAVLAGFYLYNRAGPRRRLSGAGSVPSRTASPTRRAAGAPSVTRRAAAPEPAVPATRTASRPGSAASRASASRKR